MLYCDAPHENVHDRYASLVPRPQSIEPGLGELELCAGFGLSVEGPDSSAVAHASLRTLARHGLLGSPDGSSPVRLSVRTGVTPEGAAYGGYRLEIETDGVEITATDAEAVVNAFTTLTQLLPASALRRDGLPHGASVVLPVGVIEDAPAYPWRGAMLDVARHYQPPRTALRYIDLLAAHKFNRLHLHLTDDQGFRIISEAFPRLEEAAAWRPSTKLGPEGEPDNTPHGGIYTMADLAEIASYARERGIELVPEIDVPGHTSALRAAYPELGRPGEDHQIQDTVWAGGSSVSPARHTAEMLGALLEELVTATQVKYVHLGGDECDMSWWAGDPVIAAEMAEHGYTQPEQMHGHLLRTLAGRLATLGVRALVWDEAVLTGGVLEDTIVTAWRGDTAQARSARTQDVVRSPLYPTYFNFDQSDDESEPRSEGGPMTVEDVAKFEPIPSDWDAQQAGHVLGGQFQIWTEWVNSERKLDYLAFPRACALAEVLWSGPVSNVPELVGRIKSHLPRLDALGVEYRPFEGPKPWQAGGTGVWQRTARGTMDATRKWLDSVSDQAS
ncbi:beta-N-acetylhexosaminidase [Arthrobacter sp. GMC3]|uniref:beta-N-acetylhexosaminidase n=1 Tax=Arthrobacter sp. GMC3 TaxID=2058894 RepID=UPI000CE33401|nr:beta-N-acetylhexosaminidase [Arthrobacter sp. GMC3]